MASGLVFDPLTLVRVAPLVSSTASLWSGVDHALFFDLTVPAHREAAEGSYVSPLACVVSLYDAGATSIATAIGATVNIFQGPRPSPTPSSTSSAFASGAAAGASSSLSVANPTPAPPRSKFYTYGLALTALHFAAVPYLSSLVRSISNAQRPVDRWDLIRRWRWAIVLRTALVDLPAWICFLVATAQSLQPV